MFFRPGFLWLQVLFITALSLTIGCNSHSRKHVDKFYNNISEDFDLICIPIIKPYRAASVDHGRSWLLELDIANSVKLSSFGVSENFIYGYGDEVIVDGQQKKGWFAFDVNSKLLAVYPSRQQLINCLNEFKLPMNDITDCNKYFDSLAKGHDLRWYPQNSKNYPLYSKIRPKDITEIKVTETANEKPDFYFTPVLKSHKNQIYFFRVSYNKKQNDLYYLAIAYHTPILVKDSLLVPVFIDSNKLEITLYTPIPVAEDKKIPEKIRLQKSKTMSIR